MICILLLQLVGLKHRLHTSIAPLRQYAKAYVTLQNEFAKPILVIDICSRNIPNQGFSVVHKVNTEKVLVLDKFPT